MMMVWQIWNVRNAWVFERKAIDPKVACDRALKILGDYEMAMVRESAPAPTCEVVQRALFPSTIAPFKLNTDAAVREGECGLGMVVRDGVGDVVMAAGERRKGCWSAAQGEAEAFKFGLQYAYDGGFRCIEAETDCQKVIDMLVKGTRERSSIQVVVDDILALARNFVSCSFYFARRSCNRVAHAIAQTSLNLCEVKVWMEDHPIEVTSIVEADKAFIT
ncbi:uncharacterized protein [Spinacia oleracea]|uniref:RNase H type-1 domain-containing protein n=1 Tax=Spinacia oleracea TaxID=3562 RepID=A0ABM3QQZ1_SPIOL|nr:uncharacterized protein LOC130461641 [Spinacia oleracea]